MKVLCSIKKTLSILLLILLFSCSEVTKKSESTNSSKEKQNVAVQTKKSDTVVEMSEQEKDFNAFIASLQRFKVKPVDSLQIEYNYKSTENYTIGRNTIQIFKKDTFNINWININNNKIHIKNLKTINPRVDGERETIGFFLA